MYNNVKHNLNSKQMEQSINLIKEYVTPVARATYDTKRKLWYIGYNQTYGVYNGLSWDKEQIDADLWKQVRDIRRVLDHNFGGFLKTHQIVALTSLIHDIGVEEFLHSDIPKFIKAKQYILVSNAFMNFNKDGRVVSVKKAARRRKEQLLFSIGTRDDCNRSTANA